MFVIPAIDLMEGQCVRLTRGDFETKKSYSSDPLSVAKEFESLGIERLHLVDLDGARGGEPVHYEVLEQIARETSLKVDFSGGLRTESQVERAFSVGACQVVVGSLARKQPKVVEGWVRQFGAEKIVIAADVRNRSLAINGWQEDGAVSAFDFVSDWLKRGASTFLCTAVLQDGTLEGPDFDLYGDLMESFPAGEFIASGGVSSSADLQRLAGSGMHAAILGKAWYEGRISAAELQELIKTCSQNG